jgi:hypothetical protein
MNKETLKRNRLTVFIYIALMMLLLSLAGCAKQAGKESDAQMVMTNSNPSSRVSAEGTDAAEPAIAAGPEGTAYVAWVEHRGKEADLMFARVNREGQPVGAPVRVNPKQGAASAWRGDPPTIAVAPDGTIYIGWTARVESPDGHATDLYLSASRDKGESFLPPVKVNDDQKVVVHGMHSLAVAADGRVHLAWLDERNVSMMPMENSQEEKHSMESNREVFTAFSDDGGQTFSANQRVASEACPCCKTSLATSVDGRVYASWRQVLPGDFRHVAVAASTDGGKTFATAVIVSDDRWILKGCPVSGPSLAVASDGALRVLWYSAGEAGKPGLYWSETRDGGRTFAPRKSLSNGSPRGNPLLLRTVENAFTVVWEMTEGSTSHPMSARLGNDGQVTEEMMLAHRGELPAAAASSGRLFVAYISKDQQRSVRLTYQ